MGRSKNARPRVTTAIRIPQELHEKLQLEAETRDTSINHLVVKAAEFYAAALHTPEAAPWECRQTARNLADLHFTEAQWRPARDAS